MCTDFLLRFPLIYHVTQFLTVCLASSNWWWTSASSASNFRRIFSKSWQAWHDINISNQILESRHFQLSVDIQCVRTTDLSLHCQPMSDTVLLRHRYYPFNRTDSKRDEISWRYLHHRDLNVDKKNTQYHLWTNSLPTFSEFRNRSSRSAMRASCLAFCLAKPLAFSSSSARAWFVSCSLSSNDFLSFVNCWNKSIPCQYRLNTRVSPGRDKV